MRILIAGCGYVGSALAERLAHAGHHVFTLRRTAQSKAGNIQPIQADLGDPNSLTALPGPFDAVAYTAAADGHTEAAYRAAYLVGLGNLIRALESADRPPERIVFTSSTGVYAQDDGQWVDENSPIENTVFSGAIMREAEALLHSSNIQGVSLRLGGIYGPGRTRTIESVVTGDAVCVEGETRYVNHQHRDDCAGALHHLLTIPNPEAVYVGVDSDPADRNTMLDWIADELGVKRPSRVSADDATRRRGGNKRCSNSRLLATGYVFRFPTYRDGYGALFDDMRVKYGLET